MLAESLYRVVVTRQLGLGEDGVDLRVAGGVQGGTGASAAALEPGDEVVPTLELRWNRSPTEWAGFPGLRWFRHGSIRCPVLMKPDFYSRYQGMSHRLSCEKNDSREVTDARR